MSEWSLSGREVETIVEAYVTCALWSSTDGDGEPLDATHDDVSTETRSDMIEDVEAFLGLLEEAGVSWQGRVTLDQFGHDLWLTRNHHGAGFWDRGLGELGDTLTHWAETMGEVSLYVGDDGEIHAQ